MRVVVGTTYHVGYYSYITNASIRSKSGTLTVYHAIDQSTRSKIGSPDQIDVPLVKVFSIDTKEGDTLEVKYDMSGYNEYKPNKRVDENFKLVVNGKVAHSAQYIQTYVIEFEGECSLNEDMFVDH
ncbi:hypothetical protein YASMINEVIRUS_1558 [Yasminevirus sp. GU-2018]|uniref:Uncharacterized protein n=1 Tax=Yasminevirus sp. GU-2018 TaxID=2420051 RepID=A0A5K0UCC8_9VIRU|nr:hypothetical protein YASMINEVIRUS_1558 [Yasminevirus sp. GU-2018]